MTVSKALTKTIKKSVRMEINMNIFKTAPQRSMSDGHWTLITNNKKMLNLATIMCILFISIFLLMLKLGMVVANWTLVFFDENIYSQINILENMLFNTLFCLIFTALLIILHESLHIIVLPGSFFSDKNYLYMKKGIINVDHDGEMRKGRYLLTLFMPFLVLSILPFIIAVYINNDFSIILTTISMINLIVSCFDIANLIICLINVPNNTVIDKYHYKMINDHSFVKMIKRDFDIILVKTCALCSNTEVNGQSIETVFFDDGIMEKLNELSGEDKRFLAITDLSKNDYSYHIAVENKNKTHSHMPRTHIEMSLWGCFETCGDQPISMQTMSDRIGEWLNSNEYILQKNIRIDIFDLRDPCKVYILIPVKKKHKERIVSR